MMPERRVSAIQLVWVSEQRSRTGNAEKPSSVCLSELATVRFSLIRKAFLDQQNIIKVKEHFSSPLLQFASKDGGQTFTLFECPSMQYHLPFGLNLAPCKTD
jgi:hypothetical protein